MWGRKDVAGALSLLAWFLLFWYAVQFIAALHG
jgi:hypothetical protein